MRQTPCVLIVDDDNLNRELLREVVEEIGYDVVEAEDGVAGWEKLSHSPTKFYAVLLDRVMPGMNGMEVLSHIKADDRFKSLPIIMETSLSSKEEIAEGLAAGAYYYLTKPLDCPAVQAIVKAAVKDYQRYQDMQQETERTARSIATLQSGHFVFRTIQEARDLSTLISHTCHDSGRVVIGLMELMLNAVEHGNLGISYDEKTLLNENDHWEKEVMRRQGLEEYKYKVVTLQFERRANEVEFLISDEGDGFDWQSYLAFSPDRAFDNHGRGIAMAKQMVFSQIDYLGKGNEVRAIVINPS